jgi:hypothetical protein
VDIVVKGRHTEVPERFRQHAARSWPNRETDGKVTFDAGLRSNE